jgi:predicted CXXCH cytochrome family protein
MKNVKLLFAAALLLASALALALDSPHDGSWVEAVSDCQSCHLLHGSAGGTLTKWSSNNDACLTCHDSAAVGHPPNDLFSSAWSSAGREAVPGTGGDQHKWNGSLTSRDARVPVNPAFSRYVASGLQCALCHDQHGVKDVDQVPVQDTFAPSSAHASYKFDDPRPPVNGVAGALALTSITAASTWSPFTVRPAAFTVRVKTWSGGAGTLEVSHDFIKAPPGTWAMNIPFTVGQVVELDDPNVTVKITATPAVGAYWQFYVSYPFLRTSNVADAMCLDCHAGRHQGYLCVEGDNTVTDGANVNCAPDGVRTYSHPVGEALGANLRGTDLAAPLDADGTAGSSLTDGDGNVPNPSNDLVLQSGRVGCTTCHAPHNADSNSLSVDVR